MKRKSQKFSEISERLPSEFSFLVFLAQSHFNKLSGFDKLPLAQQSLKDPYLFDFLGVGNEALERDIEDAMTSHVTRLSMEMGAGFAFAGRQVHLEVDGQDFYIDLLFYNYRLHRFLVVELKGGAFKPEHAGQLNFYITLVDEHLKGEDDQPSIGLILCKQQHRVVAEYALRGMTQPIGVAEYRLDVAGAVCSVLALGGNANALTNWYDRLNTPVFAMAPDSFKNADQSGVMRQMRRHGYTLNCHEDLAPEEKLNPDVHTYCNMPIKTAYDNIPAERVTFFFAKQKLSHVRMEFPEQSLAKLMDYLHRRLNLALRLDKLPGAQPRTNIFGNPIIVWGVPDAAIMVSDKAVAGQPIIFMWTHMPGLLDHLSIMRR